MTVTLEDVRAAWQVISGAVLHTKTEHSVTLSELTGAEIFLKFENHQFTASFKERGALNKLVSLTDKERQSGVIAMSAGNHAQGVAYHAKRLGVKATIVMPATTPNIKVHQTMEHGAEVVLRGATLQEAREQALALAHERNLTFIHPYDDPLVIAGQGTVALEMLEDLSMLLDVLVVPIGGGGLISGMAVAAKSLHPDIKVYGVQADLFPSMVNAIKGDRPVRGGGTIAEGIAVKQPGELTVPLVKQWVDDILTVSEDAIERAVAMYLMIEKTVAEGAGAAGLAAILANPDLFRGKRVGVPISGGNIDQRLLATVLMRDLVQQGRMARLRIILQDIPGELAHITAVIAHMGANIVDVSHSRAIAAVPAKAAEVDLVVETRDKKQLDALLDEMKREGYSVALVH